jgi:hypothetical protein
MDIFLFVASVHAVDREFSGMKQPPPLWHQVQGSVDPMMLGEGHVPEPLIAIILGSVPAALIASLPLPNGWQASSPFDVRWASLYLILAPLFWHGVGRWIDSGNRSVGGFAKIHILLRAVLVPMSLSFWGGALTLLSSLLLLAVWIVATLYVIWRGSCVLYRRITSPKASAN